MSYAPSAPAAPVSAIGVIVDIRDETKPKKAGGTFTVHLCTLNTGVVVDFGFKPVAGRVGDNVEWAVVKKYGKYEFMGPAYPGLAPATPLAARAAPYSPPTPGAPAGSPAPSAPSYSGKPFPLPRSHGDTAILRQNALTNSVKIHGDARANSGVPDDEMEAYTNSIIRTAYKLASFSSGALDSEIAEEVAERASGKKRAAKVEA